MFVRKAAMESPLAPEVFARTYKLTPTEVRVLLADKGVDYTIEVQASTDSGASWTSLGTITLVSTASEDARRLVRRFLTARYPADTEVQVRIINQTSGVKWGFGTISLVLDPAGRAL